MDTCVTYIHFPCNIAVNGFDKTCLVHFNFHAVLAGSALRSIDSLKVDISCHQRWGWGHLQMLHVGNGRAPRLDVSGNTAFSFRRTFRFQYRHSTAQHSTGKAQAQAQHSTAQAQAQHRHRHRHMHMHSIAVQCSAAPHRQRTASHTHTRTHT